METLIANAGYFWGGLWITLSIAGLSLVGSFAWGTGLVALRGSRFRPLRWVAAVYTTVVRTIPLLIFILYFYFVLAELGVHMDTYAACVLALVCFRGAYVSEVIRSGINSVPQGQTDAGIAAGLSRMTVFTRIVLPQALRNMRPALTSEGIKAIKDSTLASVIGVAELIGRVGNVNARVIGEPFLLFGFAAVVYFVLNFSLSLLGRYLGARQAQKTKPKRVAVAEGRTD